MTCVFGNYLLVSDSFDVVVFESAQFVICCEYVEQIHRFLARAHVVHRPLNDCMSVNVVVPDIRELRHSGDDWNNRFNCWTDGDDDAGLVCKNLQIIGFAKK